MKAVKLAGLIIAAAFIAIQFAAVKHDNPAGPDTFNAPDEVQRIVKRSCYDCHSNETRWPWYSYVAPASWIVAGDVHKARKKYNLSNWSNLPPVKQKEIREEMAEEIEETDMPLPRYLVLHPNARLSEEEKQIIYEWAGSEEAGRGGIEGETEGEAEYETEGETEKDEY